MFANVLGVLLAASLGSGPNGLLPEDMCLMRTRCDRAAVYCLVHDGRCEPWNDGDVCFVAECRRFPLLEP